MVEADYSPERKVINLIALAVIGPRKWETDSKWMLRKSHGNWSHCSQKPVGGSFELPFRLCRSFEEYIR